MLRLILSKYVRLCYCSSYHLYYLQQQPTNLTNQHSQVTLAFDTDGFSGNVVTMKDRKNRVMRGKRVGTRPVSANSATELSLGK